MQTGILYAIAAHLMWGLFPLYFKTLQSIPPLELMLQRLIWSALFLAALMTALRRWRWLVDLRQRPKVIGATAASAMFLSLNWYLYVWAVNNGHIIESSLGYFINPLVNVLLGYVVLKERLRPVQWTAISLAALGVLWLTWFNGHLPWIALTLAGSFGIYGLLRKTGALGAMEGLTMETLLLLPFGLTGLFMLTREQGSGFAAASTSLQWLVVASGPITAIPLLFFAAAARRLPLSLLGILQYVGPSMQFLIGVFVYHEAFDQARLLGFAAIWAALVVYSLESLWQSKRVASAETVP